MLTASGIARRRDAYSQKSSAESAFEYFDSAVKEHLAQNELLNSDIQVIIAMDGHTPERKKETKVSRMKKSLKATMTLQGQKARQERSLQRCKPYQRNSINKRISTLGRRIENKSVLLKFASQVIEPFKHKSTVDYRIALAEADQFVSLYCQSHSQALVVSKDSDILVGHAWVHMGVFPEKNQHWTLYKKDIILDALNLSREAWIACCVVSGTDYTQNIYNLGLKTNLKYFQKLGDLAPLHFQTLGDFLGEQDSLEAVRRKMFNHVMLYICQYMDEDFVIEKLEDSPYTMSPEAKLALFTIAAEEFTLMEDGTEAVLPTEEELKLERQNLLDSLYAPGLRVPVKAPRSRWLKSTSKNTSANFSPTRQIIPNANYYDVLTEVGGENTTGKLFLIVAISRARIAFANDIDTPPVPHPVKTFSQSSKAAYEKRRKEKQEFDSKKSLLNNLMQGQIEEETDEQAPKTLEEILQEDLAPSDDEEAAVDESVPVPKKKKTTRKTSEQRSKALGNDKKYECIVLHTGKASDNIASTLLKIPGISKLKAQRLTKIVTDYQGDMVLTLNRISRNCDELHGVVVKLVLCILKDPNQLGPYQRFVPDGVSPDTLVAAVMEYGRITSRPVKEMTKEEKAEARKKAKTEQGPMQKQKNKKKQSRTNEQGSFFQHLRHEVAPAPGGASNYF